MGRVRVLFTQQPWAQSLSLGALTPPHSRTHALPPKKVPEAILGQWRKGLALFFGLREKKRHGA